MSQNGSPHAKWDFSPEHWLVIEVKQPHHFCLFGTWSNADDTNRDMWRINTTIDGVSADNDYYYFYGEDSDVYRCSKDAYGSTTAGYSIIQNIVKDSGNNAIILDDHDWMEFKFNG